MPKRGSHQADTVKIGAFERKQREHVEYQPIGVRAQKRQAEVARAHGSLKPMRFVSLHHHSTFSFLDGFQLPEAHVRRATEINMGAIAMTEHGNIFSHVQLEKAAVKAGVKPIFGCELYCGWTDEKRRSQKKNHLTVIAKNAEGYRNLLDLVTRSWREGFYHDPTVDWSWLPEHQKGLIILSGCQGSALFTALVGGKHVEEKDASYRRGLRVARWMAERFDDFYIEVQAFPELEKTCRANPMLARIARAVDRPLVATMDCHYTAPEEAEVQAMLHNTRPGEKKTLEEQVQDWGYDVPLCHPPTDMSIYRRLRETGLTKEQAVEAIVSTEEIAQECELSLPKLERPKYPLPPEFKSAEHLWRAWIKDGWYYRGCDKLPKKERDRYRAQLKHEMELIEAKGYVDYFLIVADAIRKAKELQIPIGPARGSAAASLACYLLRITEVNPMLFDNLVFERFIDWSREDMPDIDIDFATYGRVIIREYLVEKYGEGRVGNIGTFTQYKAKNSLDDIARVHSIPKGDVKMLKDVLIERSSGDLRSSATIEDTVDQFDTAYEVMERWPQLTGAMDFEGNYKAFGIHAAGLVVATEPLTNVCAILERPVQNELGEVEIKDVISMDMRDAERQGMDKLDFLSLATMDMIAEAMKQIDMSVEELYAIPLDDPDTIEAFRRNDVIGIFQFDGRATRYVNGVVKPDSFEEIALMVALSRPGPLHNGAVEGYVDAKFGGQEPDWIHESLIPITKNTLGQIIYQEQILRIVRYIGDFDWTGAGQIRQIIAKKKGEQEFNRNWSKFRKGALTVHERMDVPPMDEETAKQVWGMMTTSGAYAFNAAHTISYGMISFWSQWFKQHHTAAFFAASLAKIKNDDKLTSLRRDAVKGHGPRQSREVLPPALDSDASWRVESDSAIRAGWSQIRGVGPKMAHKIEDHQPFASWGELINVPGIGPKTIDTIQSFVAREDPFGIHLLDQSLASVSADLVAGLEVGGKKLPVPTHQASEIEDAPPEQDVVCLAQPVHRNIRDIYEVNRAKGEELDESTIKRPDLSQWVVLTVRDGDGQATFIVGRFAYPRFKEAVWGMKLNDRQLVLIKGNKGKANRSGGRRRSEVVFVDELYVIEPDEEDTQ